MSKYGKWFWVTREEESHHYYKWGKRPKFNNEKGWYAPESFIEAIHYEDFEKLHCIYLKGGKDSIIRVRLEIKQ